MPYNHQAPKYNFDGRIKVTLSFFIRNLKLRLPKNFLIFEQNFFKISLKFFNSEKT